MIHLVGSVDRCIPALGVHLLRVHAHCSSLALTRSAPLACPQGVIKLGDKRGESKCTLVYGQMNEPPGARARVALTGKNASH